MQRCLTFVLHSRKVSVIVAPAANSSMPSRKVELLPGTLLVLLAMAVERLAMLFRKESAIVGTNADSLTPLVLPPLPLLPEAMVVEEVCATLSREVNAPVAPVADSVTATLPLRLELSLVVAVSALPSKRVNATVEIVADSATVGHPLRLEPPEVLAMLSRRANVIVVVLAAFLMRLREVFKFIFSAII